VNKLDDEQFLTEIRKRLDQSVEEIHSSVALRLNKSREEALNTPQLKESIDNDPLVDSVVNTLDDNSELSPIIEHRLNQIRQNAIARIDSKESVLTRIQDAIQEKFASSFGMPASMYATACLMITVASLFYVSSRPAGSLSLEEELTLIASADDIELYENLDFYLWLAENGLPD
jgi:hypothetical protein